MSDNEHTNIENFYGFRRSDDGSFEAVFVNPKTGQSAFFDISNLRRASTLAAIEDDNVLGGIIDLVLLPIMEGLTRDSDLEEAATSAARGMLKYDDIDDLTYFQRNGTRKPEDPDGQDPQPGSESMG